VKKEYLFRPAAYNIPYFIWSEMSFRCCVSLKWNIRLDWWFWLGEIDVDVSFVYSGPFWMEFLLIVTISG